MILIDSNVLMYAAGTPHRNKAASADFIERIGAGSVDAVLDAEVLQEILHRYRAIGRWASTYDHDFDRIPGIRRLEPSQVS